MRKSAKRKPREVQRPVTVRFTPAVWDAIRDFAAEEDVPLAEVVRSATLHNLNSHFGSIKYIDKDQGEEIKRCVTALFDTISKIQLELHRIGVNFNTLIKLKQIERKYAGRKLSVDDMLRQWKELDEAKKECRGFSQEDLDALISRYEKATEQIGGILCRILT